MQNIVIPKPAEPLLKIASIIPEDTIPKALRKSIQARASKRSELWEARNNSGLWAHHEAKKSFTNSGVGDPPIREEYEQRKLSATNAIAVLDSEGQADTREALTLVREAVCGYLSDRESVERSEAELLGIKYIPGCVVTALRDAVKQLDVVIRKERGCPLKVLASFGFSLK